ncbi:UNVERIFIED_CONTAM: hypothetical protein HHA_263860 [Hammondia hammondi]|eukprot:XP_008887300.1 hypothetical protein HHA_263860 [Hammondia hammondi]
MGRGRDRDRRLEADRRRSREERSPSSSGEEQEGRRTVSSPSRSKRIKAEKNRRRREGSRSRSASRSSERHRRPRARTSSASSPEQERTREDSRRGSTSRSPPQKEAHRQGLRSDSPEDPHNRYSSSDVVTKPFSSSESSMPSSSLSSSSSFLPSSAGFVGFRRRGFDASLARLKAVHAEESTMYASAADVAAARQTSDPALDSSPETGAGTQEAKCSPAGNGGEPADEEDEEAEEMKLVLKSMRDLQRTRQAQRRKGLDIVGAQEEQRVDAEEEEDDLAGYGLLERNFSTVNTSTGLTVDKHLEEFLRERMQLKETPDPAEEAAEERQSSGGANELYRVPDRLQVADRSGEYREQLNWLTGLTEVHLPMTVKLKNIEATEKAKRALLKKGEPDAVDDDEDPDAIRRRAFGQRYTWYDPDRRPRARAGDDKAVQDFSQRARRAQQNRGRVGIGYG